MKLFGHFYFVPSLLHSMVFHFVLFLFQMPVLRTLLGHTEWNLFFLSESNDVLDTEPFNNFYLMRH